LIDTREESGYRNYILAEISNAASNQEDVFYKKFHPGGLLAGKSEKIEIR